MTRLRTSPNGQGESVPAAPVEIAAHEHPESDAGVDDLAATTELEDQLSALAVQYPFQIHLRGCKASGKSSLAAAMDDVISARAPAGTDRSAAQLDQSLNIIHGKGTISTAHVVAGKEILDQVERVIFPNQGHDVLLVSFPHDPKGGPRTRRAIEMYANPQFMLVPVVWGPRTDPLAARNVFFQLAALLQSSMPDGTDARDALRQAFKITFNDLAPIGSYGADGMDELLADEGLGKSRIRVPNRTAGVARMSFEGLGRKARKFEETLVELTEKVVRDADKRSHDAYREILHATPNPLLYVAGWDLIVQYDALYRQPTLPEDVFRKFIGSRIPLTNKNLLLYGNVTGRIKPSVGQVYVRDTVRDGAHAVLAVWDERIGGLESMAQATRRPAESPAREVELQRDAPASPADGIAAEPAAQARPAVSEREEDLCRPGDEAREAGFRAIQLTPIAAVLGGQLWAAGVRPVPWLFAVGVTLLGAWVSGFVWARIRNRHCRGSWAVRSDRVVVLRQPIGRTCEVPAAEVVVKASLLERLLDTARCYRHSSDARPWRVFRLNRLVKVAGLAVRPAWGSIVSILTIVALVAMTVIRTGMG